MKHFIFLSLFIFLSFSCTKPKSPQITFDEQIMGVWELQSFVINSCPDPSNNVAMTTANEEGCLDVMGDTECLEIHFKEEGKAEFSAGGVIQHVLFELDPEDETVQFCLEGADIGEPVDCVDFHLRNDKLYNDMDEAGCICTWGFHKLN